MSNTLSNTASVNNFLQNIDQSFSLKSNGSWQTSAALMERVKMLRSHNKGPMACTSSGGWGNSGSDGDGNCQGSSGWSN